MEEQLRLLLSPGYATGQSWLFTSYILESMKLSHRQVSIFGMVSFQFQITETSHCHCLFAGGNDRKL